MTAVAFAFAAILGRAKRGPSVVRRLLFLAAFALATPAFAQAPPSASNGWDNAYYQIRAESLHRAGQGKWVYTADGYTIGRIADVRTAPDGQHEVAVIRVRRLMGGGEVALPIHRLTRQKGRIVAKDDRVVIRAMERLDVVAGARR